MKIKIVSEKKNPLLKRSEVHFQINHNQTGSTPSRTEVRKAVADALKKDENLVFVKKLETKTGSSIAVGLANIYDSLEQAKLIEPDYIIKRNILTEKEEKEKEENV